MVSNYDNLFIEKIKKIKNINVSKYYSGEGIIINNNNAKGVISQRY